MKLSEAKNKNGKILCYPRNGERRFNLKANNKYEEILLKYIEDNASDSLAEKIKTSNKTLTSCWAFIKESVREKAVNGCVMVEDKEVFGLAMHYFEEDDIKAPEVKVEAPVKKVEPKKPEPKKPEPKKADTGLSGQMSLFDFA